MTLIPLPPLATDQKTMAEREWCSPHKARAAQKACDIGLFSDDASQLDLEAAISLHKARGT